MRTKEIESMSKSVKLSKEQKEIVIGTVLGDGHLSTQNGGKTYTLKTLHSSKQKFYVHWKYTKLKSLVRTPPKERTRVQGNKAYNICYFNTLGLESLSYYGTLFYVNKRKIVPDNISALMTPLTFAVWIMDDGSAKSKNHRAVVLNSQGFSRENIELLRLALMENFSIRSSLRYQKDGIQILISGESAHNAFLVVKPFLLKEFYYKFGALVNKIA